MSNRIMSLHEYASLGVNPTEGSSGMDVNIEFDLDETMLDELVELVGSEEDVEAAAEAAFKDLSKSFEMEDIKMEEGDVPEKLALASLVVKLVEMGKLGPEEADNFIESYLD